MNQTAILLITCPDRKGLVARVATLLYQRGANILHADQHQDHQAGLFFMRVEWALDSGNAPGRDAGNNAGSNAGASSAAFDVDAFRAEFAPIAAELQMTWRLELSSARPRVAIFVSQYMHCLADLLHRHQAGELGCDIRMIVSNHEAARPLAGFYKLPFHYTPFPKPPASPGAKAERELAQIDLLEAEKIDLVILARYMQILSADFVGHFPNRVINVHHSFLPAFVGAKPYHQAFERGVKLIGSTSHYVTAILDDGPIIEQDVMRVSHRDQLEDLVEKGRDLERIVLSRAVKWHLDHRILRYGDKTVVFN